jgi:hypothetical protein
MKRRFLLHSLNHTILCVDISSVDIPAETISDLGKLKNLPLTNIYESGFQIVSSDTIRPSSLNPDLLVVSAYYAKAPAGAPMDSDAYTKSAEWSRDSLQIFFTKGVPGKTPLVTNRIFWDGTTEKRFSSGSYLVVGK